MATVPKGAVPEDGNPQDAAATAPLSSWLLGLPPELQVEIFTHLERADLCRLQVVRDGLLIRHDRTERRMKENTAGLLADEGGGHGRQDMATTYGARLWRDHGTEHWRSSY